MPYPKRNRREPPQTMQGRVGRPPIFVSAHLVRNLKEQGLSIRDIVAVTDYSYGSVRRTLNGTRSAGPQFFGKHSARG